MTDGSDGGGSPRRSRRPVDGLSREEAIVEFARSGFALETHPAHLVRRVHQRATAIFQEVMAGESLSPTQFAALVTILKHGAISQNHLGRLTAMDPSTISVVVRKLVRDGLVRRSRSRADQRLAILTLTEEGQGYTLARLARSAEVGRRLLAPLAPSERDMFLDLLRRVAAEDTAAPERPAIGAERPEPREAAGPGIEVAHGS